MRFKSLSREGTQQFWNKCEHLIHKLLDEFNEDVFHGKGRVRENTNKERLYLVLETQMGCLYVFPIPGDSVIFGWYQHKIPQELLKPDSFKKPDEDNLIESIGLGFLGINMQSKYIKGIIERYVAVVLIHIYRESNISLLTRRTETNQ